MFAIKLGLIGLFFITLVLAMAAPAEGSENDISSLMGKHRIEIGVGFLSNVSASAEVSANGVTTSSDANGFVIGLGYTYYFRQDFGFTVGAGVLDADATTTVSGADVTIESASVAPLLFGVKYQPSKLALSNAIRPYGSAAIGPYFGSASNVRAGTTTSTEAISETAFGMRLGLGLDFFLGKRFTVGVGLGYHWISEFENRIGSETDYSSPEFSLSLGLAFGG